MRALWTASSVQSCALCAALTVTAWPCTEWTQPTARPVSCAITNQQQQSIAAAAGWPGSTGALCQILHQTNTINMADPAAEIVVPQCAFKAWKFAKHFKFQSENKNNISVLCQLCLPVTKSLSTSKDSTSNLRKHLQVCTTTTVKSSLLAKYYPPRTGQGHLPPFSNSLF